MIEEQSFTYSFNLVFLMLLVTSFASYAHFLFGYSVTPKKKDKKQITLFSLSLISITMCGWLAPCLVYLARGIPYSIDQSLLLHDAVRFVALIAFSYVVMLFIGRQHSISQIILLSFMLAAIFTGSQLWVDIYRGAHSVGDHQLIGGMAIGIPSFILLLSIQSYFRKKKKLRQPRSQIILSVVFGIGITLTSLGANIFSNFDSGASSNMAAHKVAIFSIIFITFLFIIAFARALYFEEKRSSKKAKFPIVLLSLSFVLTIILVTWAGASSYELYLAITKGLEKQEYIESSLEKIVKKQREASYALLEFVPHKNQESLDAYRDHKMEAENILYGLKKVYEQTAIFSVAEDKFRKIQILENNMMLGVLKNSSEKERYFDRYKQTIAELEGGFHAVFEESNRQENRRLSELSNKILMTLFLTVISSGLLISAWYCSLRSVKRWLGKLESARVELAQKINEKEKVESQLNSYIDQVRSAHSRALVAMEQAECANNAKTDFLANMSHELRTPMNGIIGLTEILMDMNLTPDQNELVSGVLTSSKNLLILLNDLLDISKIEGGELVLENIQFDIHKAVSDTVVLLKNAASKKGVVLETHISEDVSRYYLGDSLRIQQILNNLIGNAIKFTERGSIFVSVSTLDLEGQSILRLVVKDTGMGIPADKHEMIFNKFSQADVSTARKFGGTGLGLAITKHLVDIMHGNIELESEVGEGTTFTVDLPLQASSSAGADCTQEAFEDMDISQNYDVPILVVDDHPINLLFMRKALMKLNFMNVDEAHSGIEAVRMFERKEYKIILMDCQMPEMDGYEASMHIRMEASIRNTIPVIVAITADAMKGAKERCLEAGMNDYISKPIDIGKLQNVLAKWLDERNAFFENEDIEKSNLLMDFDRLDLYSDGDGEEIKYMIDLFLNCADECLKILEKDDIDHNTWQKAAHRLKGSAANFGAQQLSELCADAEELGFYDSDKKLYLSYSIKKNYDDVLMSLFQKYP